MADLPYFKFFPADWLADVLHLTLGERGAYITLLAWSWRQGPLPSKATERARILGVTARTERELWQVLSAYWDKNGAGYINRRLEKERALLAESHQRRVEAGRKGGLA